jgi:23S rRNA pseudouridine2605 synthase
VTDEEAGELDAASTVVRKASARETHLIVELRRGRNREVRKLFESIGHEVTALKRVRFGGLELGDLRPGEWKELTRTEVEAAFARWPGRERRADRDW